ALMLYNDILNKGFDGHQFIVGLSEHMRNLLVCKDLNTLELLEVGESVKEKYRDQANQWDAQMVLRSLGVLSQADVQFKAAKNQRLLVELALMQLCSIKNEFEKKKD
ncbi:MAG: DNA polymerase III, subunit gamma and tau, partial [Lishizhenia sp.]|nr:DNA polymerase III, subunit gamma and tau [Lishizhenia sp.]